MMKESDGRPPERLGPCSPNRNLNQDQEAVHEGAICYSGKDLFRDGRGDFRSLREMPAADEDPEFTSGVRLMQRGKLDEAIAVFKKILDENPDHINAQISLGAAYQNKGMLDEAVNLYWQAIFGPPQQHRRPV